MAWRLGLDIGTNSIGWAALNLDEKGVPNGIQDAGVRIFSDSRNPKDKQSLAAKRREPRGARRNRDRYLKRRSEFMAKLIEFGLMPVAKDERKSLEKKDPWTLRVKGLDEALSPYQLGRALFHLQQRRGFQSNRKVDKGDDESGKIKQAATKVLKEMKDTGARTIAELLAKERVHNPSKVQTTQVRARLSGSGAKAFYDFYPTRQMIEDEFDTLWAAQTEHLGATLSNEAYRSLKDTLLFQRPLKPQPVGKCTLDPKEERAPRALPSVQLLRIYQETNHLSIYTPGQIARDLTMEERDKVVGRLVAKTAAKFDDLRRGLGQPDLKFNMESERRKGLDCDKTAVTLANKKRWGPTWRNLSLQEQDAIVEILIGHEESPINPSQKQTLETVTTTVAQALSLSPEDARELLTTQDENIIVSWLKQTFQLEEENAKAVASTLLPDGHGQLGRTASSRVLEQLKSEVLTFDKAVRAAGYHSHSQTDFDGEIFDLLPYYGEVLERQVAFGTGDPEDPLEKRIGKLANPTVHVALNQIRKVINALIRRYGSPDQIVVELARDLPLSARGKSDLDSQQSKNQKANEERAATLSQYGHRNSYENRLRLRLWEELNFEDPLNRCCPYTGEQIGIEMLFSDAVEIEHILPFSQTLDDSIANKTLSMRKANRDKANRTPHEAFGDSPAGYKWDEISENASNLPNNKAWRFGPDAMSRYDNEERDFLARQLGDTRYISRLAAQYLLRTGAEVWVTPGRLTSDLRWAWGLNSVLASHNREETADPAKNRNDHRHHAIDATVVALTDRSLLQRVASSAARAESTFERNWLADFPDPFPNFREAVQDKIGKIIVAHKPDHAIEGELHEATNYGVVQDPISGENRLATRKALPSLTIAELSKIGDLKIRADLLDRVKTLQDRSNSSISKKDLSDTLETYGRENNIRRVRIHKTEASYNIISHNGHERAVIPGENFCVDLVETQDGKWYGVGVTRFEANEQRRTRSNLPKWKSVYKKGKHLMRVHKGDLLMLEKDGIDRVMQVVKLQPSSSTFALAEHSAGGSFQKRHDDTDDSFRWDFATFSKLKDRRARLIHVDPSGKVFDPGPYQCKDE